MYRNRFQLTSMPILAVSLFFQPHQGPSEEENTSGTEQGPQEEEELSVEFETDRILLLEVYSGANCGPHARKRMNSFIMF